MSGTCLAAWSQPVARDNATGRRNRERSDVRVGVRVARSAVATSRAARPAIQRHPRRLCARAADRKQFGVLCVRRVQGGRKEFYAVRQPRRRARNRRLHLDDRQTDGVGD